ncbi:hypothetical protein LTR37_014977 [Vermiconidia calcicola]|uniref:Uncharacterized protein n=1 Tax=Vermiconidia calcicola TaxID=1690605 RepID=A0ACC3MS00_9PEZI|nr:hypothetical protein LTR37_014977 [Vermiconidia calcicola]
MAYRNPYHSVNHSQQTLHNHYPVQNNQQYNQHRARHRQMSNQPVQNDNKSEPSPPAAPLQNRPQFLCLYDNCIGVGFARKADLERHVFIQHNRETHKYVDCEFPGCHRRGDYGFTRRDKMVEHLREVHKVDVPKKQGGGSPPSRINTQSRSATAAAKPRMARTEGRVDRWRVGYKSEDSEDESSEDSGDE